MNDDASDAVMRAVASEPTGPGGDRFLIGYSGGLDSTVLLHAMARAHPGRVRAIHVHHGLQPGADAWVLHCVAACEALCLHCEVARVDVVPDGRGPEAAAREARHAAFAGPGLSGHTDAHGASTSLRRRQGIHSRTYRSGTAPHPPV